MPSLYRVFPWSAAARENEPGGALYVPPQGGGRIDNPAFYSVLYLSDAASGAVAEAFGRFPEWTNSILAGSPALPGSVSAIARFQLADTAPVCNLDDPAQLLELELRPSDIVSRDYERTRGWARRIHGGGRWNGVRWWSYYHPAWSSFGLWNLASLRLEKVTALSMGDPAVLEAARTIVRRITTK